MTPSLFKSVFKLSELTSFYLIHFDKMKVNMKVKCESSIITANGVLKYINHLIRLLTVIKHVLFWKPPFDLLRLRVTQKVLRLPFFPTFTFSLQCKSWQKLFVYFSFNAASGATNVGLFKMHAMCFHVMRFKVGLSPSKQNSFHLLQ